ncbi:YbgA family protein [Vagococcus fluvialis]|uniref:YbgA family protein n=1 Tax=Vagococcus fluvialis TaxID=2738 RepID=UPI003B5C6D89
MVTDKELLKAFQSSWSKNKYWVMSRSQQGYNQIRLLAKGNDWTVEKQQEYELVLEQLNQVMPTEKTLRVTYQHVWGYFKKQADNSEKETYQQLISRNVLDDGELELFLKNLAVKYNQEYLLKMRWLLD